MVIAAAAVLAGLIGLAVAVLLSPLLVFVALLATIACFAVLAVKLLRRRPGLIWGVAGVVSLVLVFVFGGVAYAVYGGGTQGEPPREVAERGPEPREEATRPEATAEETTAEKTTVEKTTAEETAVEEVAVPVEPPPPLPPPEEPEESDYATTVTVTRVIDGDTIEILPAVEGVNEVRLIGIDTPETKDPSEEVEPYGPEASAFATSKLDGQEVGIELDSETTDRYGRLLAYVYLEDEMFNATLVEEGYAQTWFIPPNTLHEGGLVAAQEGARASAAGIWGLPLEKQCLLANHGNGIGEGSPGCVAEQEAPPTPASQYEPPPPAPSPSPGVPAGGDVDCSDFSSSAEAQAYLLPGDPYRLDADGDGQACDSLP